MMPSLRCGVLAAGWSLLATAAAGVEDSRHEIPADAACAAARMAIRDLFKNDFAGKTREGRLGLARKLLDQAKRETNDVAARYVLLDEARRLGMEQNDLTLILEAAASLTRDFRLDPLRFTHDHLESCDSSRLTVLEADLLASTWLRILDDALAADRYDDALAWAKAAAKAVAKCKDVALIAEVEARQELVEETAKAYRRVQIFLPSSGAETTLDDPAACGAAGEFLSVYKGDWNRGCALLARGPEGALREAALADLDSLAGPGAAGGDPEAVKAELAGQGWLRVVSSAQGTARERYGERALFHYRRALGMAAGLEQMRLEKELQEIEAKLQRLERDLRLSELEVLTISLQTRGYEPRPLEAMTISRNGETLTVKNTTGVYYFAYLASRRALRGDFRCALEIAGSPLVGLISENGTLAEIAVALKSGSHRVEIERRGDRLVFRINGRPVEARATFRASDTMSGRIFLRLAAGNSCSIRKWTLWTEDKPPASGKP